MGDFWFIPASSSRSEHLQQGEGEQFFSQGKKATPFFPAAGQTKASASIQAKLNVGEPGDEYEKEADTMADKVVQRKPLNGDQASPFFKAGRYGQVQRKCGACEEEEKVQTKENNEEEEKVQPKPEHRKEEELVQPKCAACENEEDGVQAKPMENGVLNGTLTSQIQSGSKSGDSLPAGTQEEMSSSFGADFSNVKVHTDSEAAGMNKQLNSQAFTYRNDIYFNEGKYNPGSESGKRLLAHELTHTIQQGAADTPVRRQEEDNAPAPPAASAGTPAPAPAPGAAPASATTGATFIVEDTETPSTNQLKKTDFITRLNREVCTTVDEELAGTPLSSATCPYLTAAFQRLTGRTPAGIEALLKRYEPLLRSVTTLEGVFDIIKQRVRTAVSTWLQNGDLSGIPPEIASQIPERFRLMAQLAGRGMDVLNTITSGVNTLVSGTRTVLSRIGSIFFKSKNGGATPVHSPGSVMQQLGTGRTIPPHTRGKMESAFGTDFSNVQLHTGGKAGELSRDMNAKAFTVGNHVAFGSSEYRPGTLTGDALLAHELAHVQQQKGATRTQFKGVQPDEQPLENEADNTAVSVMSRLLGGKNKEFNDRRLKGLPALKSGLQLQRCCGGAEWDENIEAMEIEVYTTTSLNEPPVNPGEAVMASFPSFAVRLNTHEYRPPTPMSFTLTRVGDPTFRDVRRPSSSGISRFMRPPIGRYVITADVATGIPGQGVVQVERDLEIIQTLEVLSDRQAPGDLARQSGQTLQGNLLASESMATVLRQNSVIAANVPADLIEAWNSAHAQAILVEGAITGTDIDPAVHTAAKESLTRFYARLRTEISGRDVTTHHQQTGRGPYIPPTITNPFRTQAQTDANINALARSGTATSEWRTLLNTFYEVTNALNNYVAERLEQAGFVESAAQLRVAGPVSSHLRELFRDHPDAKPVQAVFYPKLQNDLTNDAPAGAPSHYTLVALPQRMYTYRTSDGVWHLVDITRPNRKFETEESGGSATQPPDSLMSELDSPERFPEGILHYQFDGGTRKTATMTHPWSVSDVLNLISGVLAVAGILALIVGSGGTAIPALVPTLCFVASGIIGAAGAVQHMRESSELGTLTTQTIVIDSISVAANLLSAGAAGAGHIVKAAQASEAAWTGYRGLSALGAQAVYRPIQIAALATDFASLAAFTGQTLEQVTQIQKMPEGEQKTLAMRRLVVQALLTGGMTLISIRGGMHDIGAGRTLYLDMTMINGVRTPVAHRVMPEGNMLAHPRLGAARSEAEEFLRRTDIDGDLAERFRGELSVSLSTAGISESEIRSFVQRMRAASAVEARQILSEFRNNRVSVSLGGVSRSAGYDLTYFHTSPVDFHASVRQALEGEGKVGHNGRLVHLDDAEISSYRLHVDGPDGNRVSADVQIVYQDFSAGSAVGAGSVAPGASAGPARNVVVWDAGSRSWRVRIEVDQRLSPRDIGRAVGHELDESADIINRLHGSQGPDIQARIRALQEPGMFKSGGSMTSHDFATLREIDLLLQADRSANPRAGDALSVLLRDLGLTADAAQFQSRLQTVLSSGAINPSRATLLEAWATYDMAVSRGSRIRGMTREEFISEYENGRRFDEGGTYRWYNVDSERGTERQFFSDAEMADHNLAFQRIAGATSTSSYRPFHEMITSNGIATEAQVRARLSELMNGPRGRDLDFVRHELKETYRPQIITYITDRARLRAAHTGTGPFDANAASHAELLRVTNGLNSADKGTLAERWYRAVYAPGAAEHVRISGASGTTRFPDLVHTDGTLQDVKHIEGRLSAREIEQFDDYRRSIGTDVTVTTPAGTTSTVRVQRVRYAFINPAGAEANAGWMHSTLTTSSGGITFEIFNSRGQRRIVNGVGVFDLNGTKVAEIDFLTDSAALRAWLNP